MLFKKTNHFRIGVRLATDLGAGHLVQVSSVLRKDGEKKVRFYCEQPEVPAILISRLLLDMRGKHVARRCKLISLVFKPSPHKAQRWSKSVCIDPPVSLPNLCGLLSRYDYTVDSLLTDTSIRRTPL